MKTKKFCHQLLRARPYHASNRFAAMFVAFCIYVRFFISFLLRFLLIFFSERGETISDGEQPAAQKRLEEEDISLPELNVSNFQFF